MEEKLILKTLNEIQEGIKALGEMLQYLLAHVVEADEGEDGKEPPAKPMPSPKHFKEIEKHRSYLG